MTGEVDHLETVEHGEQHRLLPTDRQPARGPPELLDEVRAREERLTDQSQVILHAK
nr:hypothetical protein [Lentzea aerocolonigenes]